MGRKLAALSRGLPGLGMAMILDSFHLDGTTPVEWQYVKSEANQLRASRPRFFRNSGNILSTPAAFFALVTASPLSTSALVYGEEIGLLQSDCLVVCDSSFLISRWASLVVGTFELHSNRAAASFAVTLGGWY